MIYFMKVTEILDRKKAMSFLRGRSVPLQSLQGILDGELVPANSFSNPSDRPAPSECGFMYEISVEMTDIERRKQAESVARLQREEAREAELLAANEWLAKQTDETKKMVEILSRWSPPAG